MSKKKEKKVLTPDQEKFIKKHRKKYLREAGYGNQSFVDELEAHLSAYVRYNPQFIKSVKFADGKVYRRYLPLEQALVSDAMYIRSSMHRYHKIFVKYENTGNLPGDPLLDGPFYELYEHTCRADTTLERINEIVHDITYLEREDYGFILLSLMYELGGQMKAINTMRMGPAAENTLSKKEEDIKRGKQSRRFPDELLPWLIERAEFHDAKGLKRRVIFNILAKELQVKKPVKRVLSWRCLQDHLLKYLPPRRSSHRTGFTNGGRSAR